MIGEALAKVRQRIDAAAHGAGRDPSGIKLVAVSKTQPVAALREAMAARATVFGENKVQEAEDKIREIGRGDRAGVEWHLIGHLQSNKARRAVELFDVIQSLDSVELAQRLERICDETGREQLSVLVQVDLAGEATKSGIAESELASLAAYLSTCRRVSFDGLMVLPPFFDDGERARPFFQRLREFRDKIIPNGHLSMGMTNDFEVAIEEGATIVRVGTAIFGSRDR